MLEHVNIAMNTLAQTVKNLSAIFRFDPWVGKIPWRRERQPTPVFLPGESPWIEEPGGLKVHRVAKTWT